MSVGYNKQLYRTSTSNVYRSRPCQRGFTCHSFTAPSNRRISYGGGLRHAGIVSSSGLGSSIGLGGSVALGSSVGLGSNVGLGSSAGLGSNVVVNPAYNVGLDYNLSSGVGSYKSSYGTVPAAVSYHGLGAGPVIGGAGPTYGPGGDIMPPLITNVTVNESLLAPITMEIDPKIQAVHQKEKEEIKILNNRFAVFIERVRLLEQQNKMLETKWALLQEQTTSRSNIDTMFDAYIVNLQSQLDNLRTEKLKQEGDLKNMQGMVEDFRNKYEDEINKRAVAENEFVVIKKDVDATFMQKTEIEARLGILQDEINFLRNVYEAELHELQGQIKDTSVVVAMDNARNLDTDAIVSDVRSQYELITSRTRNEAEQYYKQRVEEMQTSASTYGEDLRSSKTELVELTRLSTRLVNEIELIKNQRVSLETQIAEAEEQGELAVKDAKFHITELEEALNTAKQELAKQLREYQELMTIKLALDIEITAYKTLLEGEEYRISTGGGPATVHVKDVCTTSAPVRARAAGVGVGVPSLGLDVRGTAHGYGVSGSQFSLGVGGSNLGFGGGSSNLRLGVGGSNFGMGVGGSNLGMGVGGSCLDLGVGNVTGYGVNVGRSGRGNYGYGNYRYSVARSSAQSSHY